MSLDGRQQQLSPPRQTRLWPDMLQGVYILMPLLVFQNMLPSHPGRAPLRSTKPGDVYHSGGRHERAALEARGGES